MNRPSRPNHWFDQVSLEKGSTSMNNENILSDYIHQCDYYGVSPDAGIIASLKYGLDSLSPSSRLSDIDMVPIAASVRQCKHFKILNLAACQLHPMSAPFIVEILENNDNIQFVDLHGNKLGPSGLKTICRFIRQHKRIHSLDIASNQLGPQGGAVLLETLLVHPMAKLDISRNDMGYNIVRQLVRHASQLKSTGNKKEDGIHIHLDLEVSGNFNSTEFLNSATHGIGFIVALFASSYLLGEAAKKGYRHYYYSLVYCFTLCLMYLSSTLYHSFFKMRQTQKILKLMDHISIYFLIAGTYTPVIMISFYPYPILAYNMLAAVWALCFGGVLLSVWYQGEHFSFWSNSLYATMGWLVVVVSKTMYEVFPMEGIALLLGGGLFYTIGIYFVVTGRRIPINHTIWHMLVIAGSTCHFNFILHYVILTQ